MRFFSLSNALVFHRGPYCRWENEGHGAVPEISDVHYFPISKFPKNSSCAAEIHFISNSRESLESWLSSEHLVLLENSLVPVGCDAQAKLRNSRLKYLIFFLLQLFSKIWVMTSTVRNSIAKFVGDCCPSLVSFPQSGLREQTFSLFPFGPQGKLWRLYSWFDHRCFLVLLACL